MILPDDDRSRLEDGADAETLMAAYGIARVPVEYYHWSQYRYTSLKDAVAAARRGQTRQGDLP